MRRQLREFIALATFGTTALWGATREAEARTFWECLTGKNPVPTASNCGSCAPGGQCGTAPAAGAAAAPGTNQPYMVPIGPPRYVPATPGAQPGAPSLSPTGASLPLSDPANVSRPVYPSSTLGSVAPAGYVPQTTYYQPPTSSFPSTTIPSTVPSTVPRTNVAPSPVMPAAPLPGAVPPGSSCPSCQQRVGVTYKPYTAYRDQMIQVPTTLYRPVTTVDPRTGAPTTVLQPCQVNTWQVQRVPVPTSKSYARAYRPLPLSKKPAPVAVVPMAVPPTTVAAYPTNPPMVVSAAPQTNVMWLPTTQAAPSAVGYAPYTSPTLAPSYATTVPGASYAMPPAGYNVPATGYAAPPAYTPPPSGAVAPPASSTVPGAPSLRGLPPPPSGDPADVAPSLRSPSGAAGSSGSSGASFRPSIPKAPVDSSYLRGSTDASSAVDGRTSTTPEPKLAPVPPNDFPLRPIPTPPAEDTQNIDERVPPLIVPADNRTARESGARNLTTVDGAVTRAVHSTNIATPRRLDDSGWRTTK